MATAEPLAIIDELLSTVDYLRISVGDVGERWLPCEPLVGDSVALAALIATTKSDRGTDRDDVATSLFVQGYAFRIASVAIGSWLLAGAVLDVSPSRTSIAIGRGRPERRQPEDAAGDVTGERHGRSRRRDRGAPRPVGRHRTRDVPGRDGTAVGQRGRLVCGFVRRVRR